MRNHTCPEEDKKNQAEQPVADTAKRIARSPKIDVPLLDRAAVTLNEFSALFGRQNTWGYRQMYAGRIKVLKDLGRILVPRSEVQRLMNEAGIYDGTK